MIMMIGFVTMGALVWVLAVCMAGESNAEKRRVTASTGGVVPATGSAGEEAGRRAA